MTVWIIAAVLVVAAFVLAAKLLPSRKPLPGASKRITEVHHDASASDGDDRSGPMQTIDLDLRKRIARILTDSGKIHAIKELRDATGWGLKDSKDYVDALERDGVGSENPARRTSFESLTPATGDVDFDDLDHEGLEQVMEDIRHGRKINAIKQMREMTGLGLKEAKDLVEDIERQGLHH